ncbi:uncharacterized protein G2W53_029117 [Senna tora]|uniref:Uncharacterized protein n=1 Tax=Senna tora TaxID=362788 RepID=A0A834WBI2_9FABA|nr:uncharacterized protein G2W53_029117 [Senna tora]
MLLRTKEDRGGGGESPKMTATTVWQWKRKKLTTMEDEALTKREKGLNV